MRRDGLSRRTLLTGIAGSLAAPSSALAGLQCTPPNYAGVRLCQVGVTMPFARAE